MAKRRKKNIFRELRQALKDVIRFERGERMNLRVRIILFPGVPVD